MKTNKFLSVVLTLCVLLAAFSLTALAAGDVAKVGGITYATLAEAVADAADGDTVTLLGNTTEDVTVTGNITLDLGGYTLTNTGAGKATLTIAAGATATVKNGSIVGGASYYTIQNNGTATFDGLTATAGNTGSSMLDNYGTLTITSGTYTGGLDTVKNENTGVLNISGGTFTLEKGTSNGFTAVVFNYGALTITGGTFVQNDKSAPYGQAQVVHTDKDGSVAPSTQISGGTFRNLCTRSTAWPVRETNKAVGTTKVSGGTFNKKISDGYCADGFIPTKNADGTYGVKVGKYVAKVGNTKYETLADAVRLAAKGKTVTLIDDLDISATGLTIAANKTITLDLDGHTLKAANTNTGNIMVLGKLTLCDSTDTAKNGTGTGKVWTDTPYIFGEQDKVLISAMDGGTFTMESGLIDTASSIADNANYGQFAVSVQNEHADATVIINGGHIKAGWYAVAGNGLDVTYNGNITVNGGILESVADYAIYHPHAGTTTVNGGVIFGAAGGISLNRGKLIVNDGTITSKGTGTTGNWGDGTGNQQAAAINVNAEYETTAVEIKGGKITAEKDAILLTNGRDGTVAVSGGTFSSEVKPEYCADGFVPARNTEDGTYGVKAAPVAKIGTVEYATLNEAFAAAKDGETVTLVADTKLTKMLTISGKNFTLDLGGFNINNAELTALKLADGTNLTVQDSSAAASGMLYGGYVGIFMDPETTLTVKSGTVKGDVNAVSTSGTVNIEGEANLQRNIGYSVACKSGSTVNMTDGTVFDIGTTESTYDYAVNISGGVVENYVYATSVTGGTIKDLILIHGGEIKDATITGSVKWLDDTVPTFNNVTIGDNATVKNEGYRFNSSKTKIEEIHYVAKIGDTKYETLAEAIKAAARNSTVTLLADTRENVTIDKALTLDLNGFTLNGGTEKAKPALTITARTVTIKDSSEAQTGTIMREDTAENSGVSSHYVIDIQGNAWVMFESGKVTNNSGTPAGKGASLVRVGDDSVAKYPGLNIKGGTFTQDNFIVIKVDRGDLFLNGGTLNSANSYAVENWLRATIKGGTVNGTVAAWTYSDGSNSSLTITGGTVNGDVESVSYDGSTGKKASVSITGGTVNGTLSTKIYGEETTPGKDVATIEVTGGTFANDPTKYVVEGATVTKNSEGKFGVEKAYLAKVGNTSYYTMDEAFKAQTTSGEPVVLLRDYTTGGTFNSGSINRTVDLNGHTWTYTGTDVNDAAFEINHSDVTLTVKNGTVVSSTMVGLIPSAMGGTIKYDNSGLVLDGVTATANGNSGIETNGNNTNNTVTLKNSTLNVPNGFGIYFPSSGTLTLDNSTVNAKTMGVQVCAGSLSINEGSAVTVTGDAVPKAENDGAIQDGAAISVVNRTGYKGLGTVTVSGGKFTAKTGNSAVKAYDWANATETAFTENDKVAVSGGSFSSKVPADLCADGFVPAVNKDGTYTVAEKAENPFGKSFSVVNKPVMTQDGVDYYTVVVYSGIDSLNYKKAGFAYRMEATKKNSETVKYQDVKETTVAYKAISGTNNQGVKYTYTAEQIGAAYIYGQRFLFPVSDYTSANTALYVTPYVVTLDGKTIYGDEIELTETALVAKGSHLFWQGQ